MRAPLVQHGSSICADDAGRLVDDLFCIKCHYNLRGVEAEGRCPECGLAVGRTVSGQWLRYCDPGWLARVWRGLNCLGTAMVALIMLVIMEWAGVYRLDSAWPESVVLVTANGLVATAAVFAVMGFFMATSRDPAKLAEPLITSRRIARVLLIGVIIATLAILATLPYTTGFDNSAPAFTTAILSVLIAGAMCILWHASRLALRIPSRWLARLTIIDAGLLAVTSVVAMFFAFDWDIVRGAMVRWLRPGGSVSYYDVRDWLRPVGTIGVSIAGLLLLVLFAWYYVAMRRQSLIARSTWARVPFQPASDATVPTQRTSATS